MPIGLTEMYFRAQMPRLFETISRPPSERPPKQTQGSASNEARAASFTDAAVSRRIEVLASWGAVYPMLTSRIRSRRLLSDFCAHPNFGRRRLGQSQVLITVVLARCAPQRVGRRRALPAGTARQVV